MVTNFLLIFIAIVLFAYGWGRTEMNWSHKAACFVGGLIVGNRLVMWGWNLIERYN